MYFCLFLLSPFSFLFSLFFSLLFFFPGNSCRDTLSTKQPPPPSTYGYSTGDFVGDHCPPKLQLLIKLTFGKRITLDFYSISGFLFQAEPWNHFSCSSVDPVLTPTEIYEPFLFEVQLIASQVCPCLPVWKKVMRTVGRVT